MSATLVAASLFQGLLLDVLGPCFASHSLRRLELLKAMPAGGGLDKKPVKPMEQLAAVSYVTMSGSLQLLDMDWNIMSSCLLGMFTGKVGKKEDKEGTSQKMSKMQSMCAGWVCVKVHGYSFLG